MHRISWRILFAVLLIGLILAAADLFVTTVSVVLLIFAGILFGIFLNGLSGSLARHTPFPYRWSYVLVVALLLALIAGGGYYMGSNIFQQVSQLTEQLQFSGKRLTEQYKQYPWVQQFLPDMSNQAIAKQAARVLPAVTTGAQWLVWGITGIVVIFFVGLYVAYDPDLYESGLVKLTPRRRRGSAVDILRRLRTVLGRWIIGRFISMSIIGVLTAVGLWLLNVPLPITLGVVAALLTFIPNIGPILAAVPQALLAFQVGTNTVLYVILFNIALQAVESYLITPMVQRYEVTLPPALTIFVQLLMGVLFGVIGIIMAAPLTASLMLVVQVLYIRDELGDPAPGHLAEAT